MPFWMATVTMAATWIDGGYLLGTAEGVMTSIASGWQGGVCFGLSLILGGVFFARRMRRLEFVTLIDPLTARFGRHWAAVLSLPAMLGEVFWSAELLVAIGATFGVMLGVDLTTSILVSAGVVTLYTLLGGMWSVGYTDSVQFMLIPLGLMLAVPLALRAAGGLDACWSYYVERQGTAALLFPPSHAEGFWTAPRIVGWWDLSIMLVFGGIPWNCYFQRIQACQTPRKAQWHSIVAGGLTIALTVPPLLLGLAAFAYPHWTAAAREQLEASPTMALPLLFAYALPPLVAILGLTAIVGAVTSSFSASILSAGSMLSWNFVRELLVPKISATNMRRVIRLSILALGALAALLALHVQSVQKLWFFTSDLVFVLLFPQLVYALYDPRANRTGSITAFVVALVLRLGGGEPILAVPPLIPYETIFAGLLPAGTRCGRGGRRDAVSGADVGRRQRHDFVAGRFPVDRPLGCAAADASAGRSAGGERKHRSLKRRGFEAPMIRRELETPRQAGSEPFWDNPDAGPWPVWVAWLAHAYTAVGLVLAAGMAVCIIEGTPQAFRWAFVLMLVACLVDATDGTLARRLNVKQLLPNFDGAKLDDLIDFLTFTTLPLALIWRAELVPQNMEWVLLVALVASAYGFCQVPAKTSDGYFVGFPSYWNIVAFYLYALCMPTWAAAVLILFLAALTFVPSYYLYPSRGAVLSRLTNFLGGVWVVLLLFVLWGLPTSNPPQNPQAAEQNFHFALASLFYPVYYLAVSWAITVDRWRRHVPVR